jgi:hypothetical protein
MKTHNGWRLLAATARGVRLWLNDDGRQVFRGYKGLTDADFDEVVEWLKRVVTGDREATITVPEDRWLSDDGLTDLIMMDRNELTGDPALANVGSPSSRVELYVFRGEGGNMRQSGRYERILSGLMALATEAHVYSNESVPGECVQLRELQRAVQESIIPLAYSHGYSWDRLCALGDEADTLAVRNVLTQISA